MLPQRFNDELHEAINVLAWKYSIVKHWLRRNIGFIEGALVPLLFSRLRLKFLYDVIFIRYLFSPP